MNTLFASPRTLYLLAVVVLGLFALVAWMAGPRPNRHEAQDEGQKSAEPTLHIQKAGSQASMPGPAGWFTGDVRVDMLFQPQGAARTSGASVTFEPGARTAWHTHPIGQVLIVTEGEGWVQAQGEPIEAIRAGDVVWIPAGVSHWHGATPTTSMTHLAIQEAVDGKAVDWGDHVADEAYRR